MKLSNLTLTLVTAMLISCSNKPIQVSPLQNSTYVSNGIVYSLPRTVISIKVDVARTLTIPGPYAAYAQKYLGISNAAVKEKEEYSIVSISFDEKFESDPTSLYSAFLDKKSAYDFFQVVNSGIVIPVSDFRTFSTTKTNLPKEISNGVNFKDLSVNPFIAEEKSTFYSKVQRDSSFVRVPVQKSMIVERNDEEKAKEASDFIFSLRKKRMEFMTIDVDNPFDGEALKLIFSEINRLENEYLSLFIGKSHTETLSKTILYTPSKPEGESSIVFRYSTSRGIVTSNDLSGNPILIEIEPEAIPESYSSFFNSMALNSDKNKFDQIYYRIPINALVKISDGKTELASKRLLIYQYGPIAKFPVKHLLIKN